jgi:ribosomal protein L7/L12
MKYIVEISPALRNQSAVTRYLMELFGPEESAKARKLTQNGGVVIDGLNERAAEEIADKLEALGVVVEIKARTEAEPRKGFGVILLDAGNKKIEVIKEIREITGYGIKKSKRLVDNLGEVISVGTRREAHAVENKLTSVGAKVEIETHENVGLEDCVMFSATINGNPAEFEINLDGDVNDIDKISDIKFGRASLAEPNMNTLLSLSVSDSDISKLEGLVITFKYKF